MTDTNKCNLSSDEKFNKSVDETFDKYGISRLTIEEVCTNIDNKICNGVPQMDYRFWLGARAALWLIYDKIDDSSEEMSHD